jgi:conjugal transfer ATP-binding protein TraC
LLAYAPEAGLFLLDEASLAFGFVCEPLAAGDQGEADRLSVLLNQDWPKDTLLQVLLWASPDLEEPLARMRGLRIEHANALLREATAGLKPQPLTADRHVRIMTTLLNWGRAGLARPHHPRVRPDRLVREQYLDYDRHRGRRQGDHARGQRIQTFSVKRFPDRAGFGLAARFLGDPFSGSAGCATTC